MIGGTARQSSRKYIPTLYALLKQKLQTACANSMSV